jgi:glutathione S-transferase
MFESGAIVMHIAERSEALMPASADKRDQVRTWLFAALNSIEPHILNLTEIDLFNADKEWAKERRPIVEKRVKMRLSEPADRLVGKDYLVDHRFTAADLLMTAVLRILRHTDIVADIPVLDAFRQRCEARAAFQKALAAQMRPFAENAPPQ